MSNQLPGLRASLVGVLSMATVLLVADVADARGFRRGQVPHGFTVDCTTCHNGRGGSRNDFGLAVFADFLTVQDSTGDVTWNAELAALDSDGDGYTNGEELGDPDGTWTIGAADPEGFTPSSPGLASETPCGNGTVEGPEQCDGANFDGQSCADFGFDEGTLFCNDECMIEDTECFNIICGDGEAVDFEECDADDLRGESCLSLGYDGGELGCLDDCTLNEDGCFSFECGNDFVEGPEACDGTDLDGQDCATLGFDGGELGCTVDCTFDTSTCEGDPVPVCGNGVIEEGEECDTAELDGATCETFDFEAGVLGCGGDCTYNTDFCRNAECGDGVIEGDEECDGIQLDDATCQDFGFSGGELSCDDAACTFVTDACSDEGEDVGDADAGGADAGGADAGGADAGDADAGGADAGGEDAGGEDAGAGEDTGGEADAGTGAGEDTGGEADAGTGGETDTGTGGESDDGGGGGGGCATAGATPAAGVWLLALAALMRRRREA